MSCFAGDYKQTYIQVIKANDSGHADIHSHRLVGPYAMFSLSSMAFGLVSVVEISSYTGAGVCGSVELLLTLYWALLLAVLLRQ